MPKQSRRNKSRENQNFAAKEVFRSVWKTSTKVWKKSTLRMWKTPVLPVHGISSYRERGSQRFQHLTSFFGILASHRNGAAPYQTNLPARKTFDFLRGNDIGTVHLYEASAWQQALLGFRQSLLDAGTEVNDALIQWQTARRRLTLDAQQIAALESAVRNSELLMRHSSQNYLKVLTARQTLLQAELDATSDRFDEIQGVVNLYHALGGGY